MGVCVDNFTGDCVLDVGDGLTLTFRGCAFDLVDSARGNGNVSPTRVSVDA